MKNIGIALCLTLSLNALHASPIINGQNSEHISVISDHKDTEVTLSVERSSIEDTFNKTVETYLKEQKTHGGVIHITSDKINFYITFSTKRKHTKGDVDLTLNSTKDNSDLLALLRRMSDEPGSEISMILSNNAYSLAISKAK